MRTFALLLGLTLATTACSAISGERYVVVDCDAQQHGVPGFPGALFTYDRDTKRIEVLAEDERFADPEVVVVDRDGTLLVVDMSADPDHVHRGGAVFRVDPGTGRITRTYTSAQWTRPTSVTLAPTRNVLYVIDRGGSGDSESARGRVFALDLATGESTTAASCAEFVAPSDAIAEPDGRLIVLDADAPGTGYPEQGILFSVDRDGAQPRELMRLRRSVSPLGFVREPGGTFLVLDANADPRRLGGPLGAIFRADPQRQTTTVLASPDVFRDPVRGCMTDDGQLLFADANADPEHKGPDPVGRGQNATGLGALFLLDPRTGVVTLAATSDRFVNPVAVARLP